MLLPLASWTAVPLTSNLAPPATASSRMKARPLILREPAAVRRSPAPTSHPTSIRRVTPSAADRISGELLKPRMRKSGGPTIGG